MSAFLALDAARAAGVEVRLEGKDLIVSSMRLEEITSGNDPSFFYRVRGPAMAGVGIMEHYPFAGAGLSGEPFIESEVTDLYRRAEPGLLLDSVGHPGAGA